MIQKKANLASNLAGILVVVVGLLYISVALSGMFTWLPVVILHALLR